MTVTETYRTLYRNRFGINPVGYPTVEYMREQMANWARWDQEDADRAG